MRPENFNLDLLGNRALLLKGLKNNKAPASDSVVNEFLNMVVMKLKINY